MAVRFECPSCGKKLKASDEKIGKKVLCSDCGNVIPVPNASDKPAAAQRRPSASTARQVATASNIAGDLLRKSTDTDTGDVGPSPYEEPKKKKKASSDFETDYAGAFKQLFLMFIPGLLGLALVVLAVYWLARDVMVGDPKRPPLGEVTGVVLLNGQPLPRARVVFRPVERGDDASDIAESSGYTDSEGRFTMYYVEDVPGAAVGMHQIEIESKDNFGMQHLPAEYNVRSTLRFNVEEGDNEVPPINIDLQK